MSPLKAFRQAIASNLPTEQVTTALFVLFMSGAFVAFDALAFENGAVATISQVWLKVNQKFWFLTYVLAIVCGILVQHVSVPENPGITPTPSFWPQALMWTPAFWVGMYVTYKWLWQLPNQD